MLTKSVKSTSKPPGSAAFTLLELLVVCSILVVLVSVSVPAISGGVMATKRVKCASNMRQIGAAVIAYATDNDGTLPVTSHSTGNSRVKVDGQWVNTVSASWIYALEEYLDKMDEIRICPADENERKQKILKIKGTSYILNDLIFDAEEYQYLQRIPAPSRTLIMFISNRPISQTWDHAHCAEWSSWTALNEDVATDRHRTGVRDANRLKGSANYLFADGHVENISAVEMKRILDSGKKPWVPAGL